MAKQATHGNYVVTVEDNGSVNVTKSGALCDNTNAALKEIAEQIGFAVDPKWNCRQLGPKILKEISGGKAPSPQAPAAVPVAAAPKAQQAVTEQKVGSSKELEAALARIAELEAENKRLKTELEKANKADKDDKSSKKSKSIDPFEGLMVKVCAGMFRQDTSYTYSVDVYPDGDHRKKPEKKWYTQTQSRRVTISKDYYICKYPVTQGQWKAIMGEGFNPSKFRGDDNLPVESVSWEECQEFIKKLNALTGKNYCLPTAAQWEWAAMGASKDNDQGKYAGCNKDEELEQYAWCGKNSDGRTHPVGQKKPNEIGLYDMCGNVYEWCQDINAGGKDLGTADAIDPVGPTSGTYRVAHGGCFYSSNDCCLLAHRVGYYYPTREDNIGFRLAMSID